MLLIQSLLVYLVWFTSTYFVVLFLLLLFKYKEDFFQSENFNFRDKPSISVLVPAYNEEQTIVQNLRSLKKLKYPKNKLEIIVVNDGSKDKTANLIKEFQKNNKLMFINNKKNKGKAAVLNQGVKRAKGQFVVCMDADTVVPADILNTVVRYFNSEKVGAVVVGVDVKSGNLLQNIMKIEYAIGISLSLGVLSKLNSVHVTPGPFSIYRKSVLEELGGFDEKNITEDMEIAYRMHKYGYNIRCCLNATVKTIAPNNIRDLYKQRKRWYTGALQTLFKHKDLVFNKKLGIFGIFVPFNFLLVLLGVSLFLVSISVSAYDFTKNLSFYRLTNFNFFDHIFDFKFDILSFTTIYLLLIGFSIGLSAFLVYTGQKILGKSIKKNILAFLIFLQFFIFYQVFWISSIYNFVFKRKVKWR